MGGLNSVKDIGKALVEAVKDGIRNARNGAEDFVDKLPQDLQDVIHEAERELRDKRDEFAAEGIELMVALYIPKGYAGFTRALAEWALRRILTDRANEDAKTADGVAK